MMLGVVWTTVFVATVAGAVSQRGTAGVEAESRVEHPLGVKDLLRKWGNTTEQHLTCAEIVESVKIVSRNPIGRGAVKEAFLAAWNGNYVIAKFPLFNPVSSNTSIVWRQFANVLDAKMQNASVGFAKTFLGESVAEDRFNCRKDSERPCFVANYLGGCLGSSKFGSSQVVIQEGPILEVIHLLQNGSLFPWFARVRLLKTLFIALEYATSLDLLNCHLDWREMGVNDDLELRFFDLGAFKPIGPVPGKPNDWDLSRVQKVIQRPLDLDRPLEVVSETRWILRAGLKCDPKQGCARSVYRCARKIGEISSNPAHENVCDKETLTCPGFGPELTYFELCERVFDEFFIRDPEKRTLVRGMSRNTWMQMLEVRHACLHPNPYLRPSVAQMAKQIHAIEEKEGIEAQMAKFEPAFKKRFKSEIQTWANNRQSFCQENLRC